MHFARQVRPWALLVPLVGPAGCDPAAASDGGIAPTWRRGSSSGGDEFGSGSSGADGSTTDGSTTDGTSTGGSSGSGPPGAPDCGNGIVEPTEQCDDGDADDDDACHNDCRIARAVQIATGGNHTCVRVDNGSVRCWGNGNNGRTGLATLDTIGDDEPASMAVVVSVGGPAEGLAAGLSHTCVSYTNGAIRCFGRAAEGQLGYGVALDIGDDEPPEAAPFVPLGRVRELFTGSGSFHGCGRLDDGSVRCWGESAQGRLGVPGIAGPLGDDEPASVAIPVDAGGSIIAIATGVAHTCARLRGGRVRCWGSNDSGQLGVIVGQDVGDDEPPTAIPTVALGGVADQVVAGWYHTCAKLEDGGVRCWGRGNNGRLGLGYPSWVGIYDTPIDHDVVDVGGRVEQLVAGNAHTCARFSSGRVRCWGWAGHGQLGYGDTEDIGDDEVPAAAGDVPVGGLVRQIAAGANHTCALLNTGSVRCWGNGGDGRLGYGNTETIGDDETPADVGDVPVFPP